ncbi:MAG: S-adenosylmethionine decarboxylase [Peptococcaceae bacterium BICA1-8]|nr:MAG: S-adenosylmethionine decarboxylase [Peptococcaceae bacterium BICA1-8]
MGFSTFGRHVIADFHGVSEEVLNDFDFLRHALHEAAIVCGATVVGEQFNKFEPQGVTGVLVLAESHLSIHTYPEHGFCAIDCYTCGTEVNPEKAYKHLVTLLKPKRAYERGLMRGTGEITNLSKKELKVVNS